jgi:hypothetical protein
MFSDRKHSIANHVVTEFFSIIIGLMTEKNLVTTKLTTNFFLITTSLVIEFFWSPQGLQRLKWV